MPRSRSTAAGLNEISLAVSRMRNSDCSNVSGLRLGIFSVYWVCVYPVEALVSAPNERPNRSNILTISPSGILVDPLKAICSIKCAKPSSSSASAAEPKSIAMRNNIWF